jgi:hypothetical protein
MAVPKKNIEDFFNPRVVDKEKYISEDINYLKDIINKKAGVIDMMSPGPLKDELRGTYDPTQESYEEFLQRQSIPQMDRPLTGQAPSDAILETQRIDLNEGGVLGPEGMFRGEDLGTREGFRRIYTASTDPARLKRINDFVIKYEKEYGYKPSAKKVRTVLNEQRRVIPFYEKKYGQLTRGLIGGKGKTTIVDQVKKLIKNKKVIEVLNKGRLPSMSQVAKVLNLNIGDNPIAESRRLDLANTLLENPKYKNIAQEAIKEASKSNQMSNAYAKARNLDEKRFSKIMNLDKLLPTYRKYIADKLTKLIPQLKGLVSVDEIGGLTSSMRRGSGPYAIFGQVIDPDFNMNIKRNSVDKQKSYTQKAINKLSKDDPKRKELIKNYNKKVDEFEKMANKNNPAKKVVGQKISLLPPSETIKNKKVYNQYKNLFDQHYKKYGYSFNVRADSDSIPDIYKKLDNPNYVKTIKNRFSKLIGKGGRLGALVGLSSLAGTGFALADEPGTESAAETAGTMLAGAGAIGAGYLGGKKLIEKTTGRFAPMIKGAIGKVLQSPFALPFRATGLDRMAMKKLGLLPEDETLAQTYDPRTASGRTTLALEGVAAGAYKPIAERLTSGIKNQTAKSLATGILKLGPRALNLANVLSKAARVTTPLGIASLAGEGIYQFVKKQKEYLESLDPEERKTVEQQYADVAAAEGGIIRKAYKDAGLVEKLGRGATALDPRNIPYYGAKTLKGLGSGVEMAVKFPVAAGAAIGETIQKGPRKETLTKFGEAVQPSATQYLSEKTGLESLIRKQEKELTEKRPGALAMGDVLELGAEFVAPATGYIKMLEDGSSKLYKVIRDGQAGKKVDPKDIDEVLELLSDKGVERRDFMAVVGGTSALALAKHVGIIDALKILEKTKPVRMLSKSASKMPEWFPSFASRILDDTNSVFKQVDEDLVEITNKNLPDVSVGKYSSGRWEISGYNEYGKPYLIDYEPPSILEDGTKYAGDFSVFDNVPSRMGPDDVEFDSELVESIDDVLGGTSKLEEWTTGVKKKNLTPGEKRVIEAEGSAEADYDAWKESDDFVDE